jgi:hypothetical protein
MKKGEWLQFCRGIGILKDEESEEVIRTTSRLWPPSGFKDGLYNDGEWYPDYASFCRSQFGRHKYPLPLNLSE